MRILIVDDSKVSLSLLENLLKNTGIGFPRDVDFRKTNT